MNTKKYKAFFAELAQKGDIPPDLYDEITAEIERDGKMTKRVYSVFLNGLEKRGLFDVDGTPFSEKNSAKTDGSYKYKRPKNPFWHIGHAVTATLYKFIGWIVGGVGYGIWRVKDAKKLKKIGACITTSNHVGYLDPCLTRRALGVKKQYIVAAPHNCKRNLGGAILKSAIVLPLPATFKGAKPFYEMLEYVRDRGAAIHFYPEKSMWLHYRKPRPYKDGAFYFAEKLGVPIVPMLYCFREPKGLRKLLHLPKAEIRIADPIYPDKALGVRARMTDLAERAYAAAARLYEEFYGEPLTYLCDEQNPLGDETLGGEAVGVETVGENITEKNQQKDEI
ncbi:MAG: 1-acyl-sn-glycerol-3-phosphate acyltransferase [Roseburia sp.]|nr:1-acyl-sn-glycerol-3-phosphate acyltransferase [Roseburia sp.]